MIFREQYKKINIKKTRDFVDKTKTRCDLTIWIPVREITQPCNILNTFETPEVAT